MIKKISISGDIWSGKSSTIREIVKRYNYQTADVGQIFRNRAIQRWMTISEYDKIVEQNPQEDIDMENDFANMVLESKQNIIVSRRMAFYRLPEMITIYLTVDPIIWAKRVLWDDRQNQEQKYTNIEDVLYANKERNKRMKQRIEKIYWVDFTDTKNYKYVFDTNHKSIDDIIKEMDDKIKFIW